MYENFEKITGNLQGNFRENITKFLSNYKKVMKNFQKNAGKFTKQ